MSLIKALAFMPRTMSQTRKVSLKVFLDDTDKPSGREEDVIREMQKKGLKIVGRKDFIYVQKNSNISIEYNLTGPNSYKRVKRNISIKEFPVWTKTNLYYVHKEGDYNMEGVVEFYQTDKFVTSFDVKATLTPDLFDYTLVLDDVDAVFSVPSSEESDSEDDEDDAPEADLFDCSLVRDEVDAVVSVLSSEESDSEDDAPEEEVKPFGETEALMGKEGGIIDVKGCGVVITIPRGALQKDTNIKFELIPNSISKDEIGEHEATICTAIRCTPSGLKLEKPMTISCEHCAKIAPSVKTGETPIIVYSSKEPIDDGTLDDLAEAIETEEHMESLGRALGFSAADINRYADTNRKGDRTTTKGTRFMLRDWRRKVGAHKQLQRLTESLKKAGLVMLADILMKADPNEALQEKILADIAEALGNDENVAELGRALGFSTAALNRYTETNRRGGRITSKGTRDMLLDWRQKISPSDQHQKLKEALTEANLVELSDNYLKEVLRPEWNRNVDRQEMRAPNCRIDDKTIEVEVDKFLTYEFRLPTESLNGKVVGYLGFLPRNMPESRKPVLNLVIYDNVPGFRKGLCKDMDAKKRISRDIERLFFIESSNHNSLEVSCRMDETDEDLRETLFLWDLNLGQNSLDFVLDCNHLSTNDSNVKVTLTHGKRSRNSILVVDMKGNATKTAWGSD